jgi:hypothetical protein
LFVLLIAVAFIVTLRELYEDVIPHLDLSTCIDLLKVRVMALRPPKEPVVCTLISQKRFANSRWPTCHRAQI